MKFIQERKNKQDFEILDQIYEKKETKQIIKSNHKNTTKIKEHN